MAGSVQVRLDVWLDVSCLFRTRSEAQKACKAGRVDVNGQTGKPDRQLRIGDDLHIRRPFGRVQHVVVKELLETHVAKAEARKLYEDLTPPPTAEEIEARRLERIYRASTTPLKDNRDRRALRRRAASPDHPERELSGPEGARGLAERARSLSAFAEDTRDAPSDRVEDSLYGARRALLE
jgi:ribosome-associated heat shock protein Hsp15